MLGQQHTITEWLSLERTSKTILFHSSAVSTIATRAAQGPIKPGPECLQRCLTALSTVLLLLKIPKPQRSICKQLTQNHNIFWQERNLGNTQAVKTSNSEILLLLLEVFKPGLQTKLQNSMTAWHSSNICI